MLAFFRFFELWGLWHKTRNHRFFEVNLFYRYSVSDSAVIERKEPCIHGESKLQHGWIPLLVVLLGIPSIGGSKNDMFQWKFFRSKFGFFDLGETRVVKKTYTQKLEKKLRFFTFLVNFFDRYIKTFNFFRLFWKIRKLFAIFPKNIEKCQFSSVGSENG